MTRGEVWWMEHPAAGRRPACILTRAEAVPVLRRVVVAPATTRIRHVPSEVYLSTEDGMPRPCALSLDNLRTVPKAILTERITTLDTATMVALCRSLELATGCGPDRRLSRAARQLRR